MSQDDESYSLLPSFVPLHITNSEWIVECSPCEDTESPLELFDSLFYSTETEPKDLYLDSQPVDEAYEQLFIETLLRNLDMVPPERLSRGAGSSRAVVSDRPKNGGKNRDLVHCCVYSAFATRASRDVMLDWATRGGASPGLGRSPYSKDYPNGSSRALVVRDGDAPPKSSGGFFPSVFSQSIDGRRTDEQLVQNTTNKHQSPVKPIGFYGPIEAQFATDNWYLCSRHVLDPTTADTPPPAWRDFEHSSIFNDMRNWVIGLNKPSNSV